MAPGGQADGGPSSHLRSDLGVHERAGAGRASTIIAKAHHGSVSKEKRLQVEQRAEERASCRAWWPRPSLELGIDMGSDRPGAAGGRARRRWQAACSASGARTTRWAAARTGIHLPAHAQRRSSTRPWWPKACARAPSRQTALVKNALDVLAQQTVAAVAMGRLRRRTTGSTRCGARRPYVGAAAPRVSTAVLDMLAGRYASADLAEFAPRIVWDRESGQAARRAPPRSAWPSMAAGHHPRPRHVLGGAARGRRRPRAGAAWASWTRRWCTSRAWATSSRWAPARGASARSRATA